MKEIKLKHIFVAAITPIAIHFLGALIEGSIRYGTLDLSGLIIVLYFSVPCFLFTLTLVGFLRLCHRLGWAFADAFMGWIALSLILVLMFFTLWIGYDGSMNDFRGKGFFGYWAREFERNWIGIVYLGLTVPVILWLAVKRKNKPKA